MSVHQSDLVDQVRSWLLARNPGLADIGLDEDLIDSRVIDSLGFTEFLLLLEELVGHEITLDASNVVVFRTLRGIRDHVLTGADR
jgi:hypothetical protein